MVTSPPYLITGPSVPAVTVGEAQTALRITGQDEQLAAMIAAATGQLDPALGGSLGRALRPQTWELRLSGFPCGAIELPYPPLTSVVSVKYDDDMGTEQTLALGTGYRVTGIGAPGKASLLPPYNQTWPIARCDVESVRVRFECGYELSPDDELPAPIKQAIFLSVRQLLSLGDQSLYLSEKTTQGVSTRRWIVSDAAQKVIEAATTSLLSPYRVYG